MAYGQMCHIRLVGIFLYRFSFVILGFVTLP